MTIDAFARAEPRAALGFSGGVDSAYLLYAGLRAGASWQPVFVRSVFQPRFELEDARRLTAALGVRLQVLDLDVLRLPELRENGPERCFFCKQAVFSAIARWAGEQGLSLLLDGTNASDPAAERPGMRALRELSVRSPLREAGLRKEEIRALSREAGLFTWEKPAYACLATRVPTGTALDAALLERVERAEDRLRERGYRDFRVRVFHGAARLQLTEADWARAVSERETIQTLLQADFSPVLLDLELRKEAE